jgi:hypothetical protein
LIDIKWRPFRHIDSNSSRRHGARSRFPDERNKEQAMTEIAAPDIATGQLSTEAGVQIADAGKDALHLMMGVQTALLQEMLFAGYEIFDRARTETHLCAEFASKIASAHSVGDMKTMWAECSRHQLEFLRRDADRIFRHGEQMIDSATKLFGSRPQN